MKKITFAITVCLFVLFYTQLHSQNDEMFKQKRERKRIWRKHRTNMDAYNPYLKKKAKNKPSTIVNKGNKKQERRQKREYKKQLKRSKKHLNK